jgi:four helix bundle protein
VFQRAYSLAVEIFEASRRFPKEERFSLTDQIRRSSRSVAANIAEGFRRRRYPGLLASRIADADAEATETQVWLDFASDCGYLAGERRAALREGYEEIGRILGKILMDPSKYRPAE